MFSRVDVEPLTASAAGSLYAYATCHITEAISGRKNSAIVERKPSHGEVLGMIKGQPTEENLEEIFEPDPIG